MAVGKPCVFCDIIAGNSPDTQFEFVGEQIVIFKDIKPASDYHFLAVPKEHIGDVRTLTLDHKPLILEMQNQLTNLMNQKGISVNEISFGFHWPPFTSVNHLHMHAIAPISKMSFLAKWIFKPLNVWYCTPEYVCAQLKPAVQS